MHPESEIAADFWQYVNERGHGRSSGGYLPSPPALMAELERQYWVIHELKGEGAEELNAYLIPSRQGGGPPVPWFDYGVQEDGYHLPPTGFPTLQAGLYDYLLAAAGDVLIGKSYEVWVMAVAHVLTDVIRDPGRLVIPVLKRTDDDQVYSRSETEPHTMAVSDNWSILRRETFDFACRNYERNS